jgi:hypothetical protein
MHDPETEVALEGIEVAVVVQQLVSALDAGCRDEGVDHAAHRDASGAKPKVILGCLDRKILSSSFDHRKDKQSLAALFEFAAQSRPSKHLADRQVRCSKWLCVSMIPQPKHWRRLMAAQVTYPNRTIDGDHAARRLGDGFPEGDFLLFA